MIEKALTGSKKYWLWLILLSLVIGVGLFHYLRQFNEGLITTGLSRDVIWGLYIAQFTFLVGVAASAVMVVLPYYLHNYKAFGKITILGEFLAASSVIMCMLFIFVDMGQPLRATNVLLHPTPNSVMFWDMNVLFGYLALNIVIGWFVVEAERKGAAPPKWLKVLIYISIPWAISIHTVTAFLYSGLPGRSFWLTAILAPRFLASAFAAGPALLILLCLILKRLTAFKVAQEALQKLATIVCYGMIISVFFVLMEFFTAYYSAIPEHKHHLQYMFFGLNHDGHVYNALVPYAWTAVGLAFGSILMLLIPACRRSEGLLALACVGVFISMWIDKGLCLIVVGLIPSPLGEINEYAPTFPEGVISIGIYAIGLLVLTVLYKTVLTVRGDVAK